MVNLRYLRTLMVAMLSVGVLAGCGSVPVGVFPDATSPLATTESSGPDSAAADAASAIPSDDCMALGEPSDDVHLAVFDNLNAFRATHGLEPLIYSRRLEEAADAHARDLYERGYFAHISPDGQTPGQRAVALGFCHEYVGENIAAGQKTADAVETAWENSTSHRVNMLEPNYKYAGVGVFQDPTGRMYWAQEMAYHLP